jgi:hypothetical protein
MAHRQRNWMKTSFDPRTHVRRLRFLGCLHLEPPRVSERVFRRPCNARSPAPNRDRQGADVFNRADVFTGAFQTVAVRFTEQSRSHILDTWL